MCSSDLKDLVTLHHGTIDVNSKVGEGTEFAVRIPIDKNFYTAEQLDEDDQPMNIPSDAMAVEQEEDIECVEDKQNTLLIVEDNEELLQLMIRLLQREYNVISALNGKEALDILNNQERKEIDLIVSDIMMPEMDGIELCKKVKGQLETSHIPIIQIGRAHV